eukprot:m.26176 g.26176  ORF g.26176 m.26176 type:complete len:173 (+) comp29152_c0_seq1:383-901(+)
MLKTLEPRCTPPDRSTISRTYLPRMFDAEKKRIKNALQSACHFAITTDLWTSRARHAYTGLTVHYINEQFDLNHHLLETKEFGESHTGANIADELAEILQDWDMCQDKLSCATTDNGSNIVSASALLGWQRMPCFSHTLQLAVEKVTSLPDVSKALARLCPILIIPQNHLIC